MAPRDYLPTVTLRKEVKTTYQLELSSEGLTDLTLVLEQWQRSLELNTATASSLRTFVAGLLTLMQQEP